jgi:hypothetical protein
LHSKASIAHRNAQARGEIRDISAHLSGAPQQFVPRCVFFAPLPTLSADRTRTCWPQENVTHFLAMFFL